MPHQQSAAPSQARPQVRFDDIDSLRTMVSADFGEAGPEVLVSQETIDRFADLTADHQWIHVDVEKAKDGPFGGTIAHGFLIVALMPRYRPPLGFDIVGESSRVNYGCEQFRFLVPVPAGSTLQARMRLAEVREHRQGTLLVQEMLVGVIGQERPSLSYMGLLLYAP